MARLSRMPSNKALSQHKIRFAGKIAESGCYVCRHCNRQANVAKGNALPICSGCDGRRFTLQ